MKKIHIKKPDIKGAIDKLKNLKKEDVIRHFKARKERRERIIEARRNSAFARKMQPVYKFMNRFSLVFHALLACIINFAIEAISRHSLVEAWIYMTGSPLVFLYNAFMIFVTFSIVYLFKRRVFVRIIISVFWMILGIANGYMLLKRVTPFNAQDLKIASDGLSLINKYLDGFEIILFIVGIAAVVVWMISMWRRGGQYDGKIHHAKTNRKRTRRVYRKGRHRERLRQHRPTMGVRTELLAFSPLVYHFHIRYPRLFLLAVADDAEEVGQAVNDRRHAQNDERHFCRFERIHQNQDACQQEQDRNHIKDAWDTTCELACRNETHQLADASEHQQRAQHIHQNTDKKARHYNQPYPQQGTAQCYNRKNIAT